MRPQRLSLLDHATTVIPARSRPRRVARPAAWALLACCLAAQGMGPVSTAWSQVPALVQPASQEHHAGKVIFRELVTPDIAAAERFYGGLFGWSFRDSRDGAIKYAAVSLGGHTVAGLIQRDVPAGEHRQPAWLTFISAPNIDAVLAAAAQHGAKLLFGPRDFPDRGREAVFADPQGAVFALLASSSGDPSDVLAAPGEWIWSSLITTDPDTGAAFYQALFGYEVFELPAAPGAEHLLLASDDYARASVNSLPAAMADGHPPDGQPPDGQPPDGQPPNGHPPNGHPHWLSYVRVEDAAAMADKVVALGGRVLVPPRIDRHGGKVAVVADPLGAPFGLLEWPSTQSKQVHR